MIGMLALSQALAQPSPPSGWAHYEHRGVAVVRPVGVTFGNGVQVPAVYDAAQAGLVDRDTSYEFIMLFLGEQLPRQVAGALAFNQTFNSDLEGIGRAPRMNDDFDYRSVLYMNRTAIWSTYSPDQAQWIFNHELGHSWLAFVDVELDGVRTDRLLGRQRAHWSYFLATGNSPMEGNAWIDNGDGTFTTNAAAGPGTFSDLDLYLMGMLPAAEVAPFYLIEPTDPNGRFRESSPDHRWDVTPTTISGTRHDVTVDDVILAEGPVPFDPTQSHDYELLVVMVVGPEEVPSTEDFDRIDVLRKSWRDGWATATRQRSTVAFEPVDEGLAVPPIGEPAFIPEAAR